MLTTKNRKISPSCKALYHSTFWRKSQNKKRREIWIKVVVMLLQLYLLETNSISKNYWPHCVCRELVKPTPIRMLVFVAAGLADPPPGTGFMFTLQSLAKMMMMGVMIMRDDVCGLFSTNIPMIPPYSIWQNFEALYELFMQENKFNKKKLLF